jgi:hypothetical protein
MGKIFLTLIVILVFSFSARGQHLSPLYRDSDTVWLTQQLYSGNEWRPRVIPVTGHEFFLSGDYLDGSVTAGGFTFSGLKLKYDIFSDEIILRWKNIHSILLNNSTVESFTVGLWSGGGRNPDFTGRRFINLNDKYPDITGFAEVIYKGPSMVVAKHSKIIAKNTSMSSYAQYRENTRLWFITGSRAQLIRNRASFLRMFGEYEDEVKRFVRLNHIEMSKFSPGGYGEAASYYDSLIGGKETGR